MTTLPEKLKGLMDAEAKTYHGANPTAFYNGFDRGVDWLWNFLLSEGSGDFNAETASDTAYDLIGKVFNISPSCFMEGARWQHSQTIAREKALELEIERAKAEIKRLEGKLGKIKEYVVSIHNCGKCATCSSISLAALKEIEQDAQGQEGN